ncbi:aspartyl/glutamyl-tRNA(Asn/Gln) amidotransferase subunit C [Polymorphobacter multimanifer]|uniref:Aspartyl/glutamyl-tRNA(Asn/Gln) amidotransferase subunit C n=1 Tax=Polymorphobacter multimanifer TaxID=1070431 RepID=A0A841LDE3_9SPHN|nr:Asp-tRNA(Asn)/Glu-tRNA(Gln) amidotransferase subunit GatC [Polymorphobacter multimanifer]MBB6226998.1 aspartyl-tRNA(Asn)/glutamyl-tRNA(Gln) amidotransferase subunit C [Polymorphobacter multimanifer]GGI77952.1 aspartyl/glutamyl-tRNA(Asn/Gln) amidotransferase subunit C [Polymorphobacter multimanifer]
MSVDDTTVRRIARLARIGITDAEVAPLAAELSAILGWVEQLAEVDTRGVPPMAAVMPKRHEWRDDAVTDGNVREAVLANAPEALSGFFAVPKVIE